LAHGWAPCEVRCLRVSTHDGHVRNERPAAE
jgi:peptide methionine sulfoxide reductase MsrB